MTMIIEDIFQKIRLHDNNNLDEILTSDIINMTNEDGQSFLHEAIVYNNLPIIKLLISNDINLNIVDKQGQTALHYIPIYDDENKIEKAELILNAGANLNISDKFGNNPLWTAVFNARGKYELVKLYLKFNVSKNNKNNAGKSPYDFANQINDKYLLEILQ